MHILVVEDDHLLNNTLCYNLNAAGYKVDSALCNQEAENHLSINHICLFLGVVILMIVILFGGFLCMTGGDNSSTVSSVSAEVEAYEPLIRQYANQF